MPMWKMMLVAAVMCAFAGTASGTLTVSVPTLPSIASDQKHSPQLLDRHETLRMRGGEKKHKVAILTAGGLAPCLSSAIGFLIEEYTLYDPSIEIICYVDGYKVLPPSLPCSRMVDLMTIDCVLVMSGSPQGSAHQGVQGGQEDGRYPHQTRRLCHR
eukprot:1917176-Rhodomonas_salina.1